ncbi:MAG: helix-turn-helix domain-containing protein [Myxococcota bacterium]|nr:helix-turn-helix domain-containing protein [Myxococcota bacterium]
MGKKQGPSAEKKMQAVMALLRKEEPAARIARRYGVSDASLYRWRDDFIQGGKAALSGKKSNGGDSEVRLLKKEIEERDQVIGELTIANRILKKIEDCLL